MNETPETLTTATDDGALLSELLDDLDAITGMIERTREAVARGKPDVRLIPRGKVRSIADALDELGDALTRRTMQARAQRALRDGVVDETLRAALDAAEGDKDA